ncbi:MAG TPA: hypothetical protein VNL96_08925 [Gemmatimonadaceae bacterium]|nr:hypothetical protein [Gemmatimonadaceae bacterium]
MARSRSLAIALLLVLGAGAAAAQRVPLEHVSVSDTTLRHRVQLQGGTVLLGRIVEVSRDSVRLILQSGEAMAIARNAVQRVEQFPATRLRDGQYWAPNPNATRLLFSPTAFPLGKGERYFNNVWLFFNHVAGGWSDRLSMGVGLSAFPTGDFFRDNILYLTPKLTVAEGNGGALAVGGFLGWLGALDDEESSGSLGILYVVGSAGNRESNLDLGLGWGYYGGDIARRPIVMVGGQTRVSRRVALISENWIPPDAEDALVSVGLRFLGEGLSADLAFLNVTSEMRFPGYPWVGFTVRF